MRSYAIEEPTVGEMMTAQPAKFSMASSSARGCSRRCRSSVRRWRKTLLPCFTRYRELNSCGLHGKHFQFLALVRTAEVNLET